MNPSIVRKIWISFAWRFLLWVWFNLLLANWALDFLIPFESSTLVWAKLVRGIVGSVIVLFTSYWALRWALNSRIRHFNASV